MSIGKKIKKIRLDNNLSQEAFSEKIKVSRQTLSGWENDKVIPNIDNINQIINVFSISPMYFFDKQINYEKDKKSVYQIIITVVAILSWMYPRLVVLNFFELIVFYFFMKVDKKTLYMLLGICIFYLITFIIYPEIYMNAFSIYNTCSIK